MAVRGPQPRGLLHDRRTLAKAPNAGRCAVVMFDIDHFKGINDGFGHADLDRVPAHATRLIASMARMSDRVARDGGEAFCMLLHEVAPAWSEPWASVAGFKR